MKTNEYDTASIEFHVANVVFDASIVLESRMMDEQHVC